MWNEKQRLKRLIFIKREKKSFQRERERERKLNNRWRNRDSEKALKQVPRYIERDLKTGKAYKQIDRQTE